MSTQSSAGGGGVGLLGLLGVAFIVLKLCNVIDWSWWWVLCPLWGGFALVGVFLVLWLLFSFIGMLFEGKRRTE